MLSGMGIQHGVDLDKLLDASAYICNALGRAPKSNVARAEMGARELAQSPCIPGIATCM